MSRPSTYVRFKPWTDSVETAIGGAEGHQGGAAAADPGPADPEAAAEEAPWCSGQGPANTGGGQERACGEQEPTRTEGGEEEGNCVIDEDIGSATTKRLMSGIEVLDSVSKSMSEMSLSSKREAAAAQGLPMLKRCVPPASEPTITMNVSPVMPSAATSKTQLSNVWFSWRSVNAVRFQPVKNPTRV